MILSRRNLIASCLAKALTVLVLLMGSSCGQTVRPLSIHDSRLPLDARRWIADAEDAVTVTAAWRDEAKEAVDAALQWRSTSVRALSWPTTTEATLAQTTLGELAEARIRLARLELALAEAELALAKTRRTQVNAETAVRYDLRYYDLEPFTEATRQARTNVESASRAVADQRLLVEEATTQWWRAFQAYVLAGGDPRVLWLGEQ